MSVSVTGGVVLSSPGVASAVPMSNRRHWTVWSMGVVSEFPAVRARRSPMWELSESMVPYASMRGESLDSRAPPMSDVVPLSPVAVYSLLLVMVLIGGVGYIYQKSYG